MARNAEKAMTTLARFRAAQLGTLGGKDRRPYLASECKDLKECERWRREILREISKKVTQIQNAGLGEYRIRDLNDEINKLLREKYHWEVQIFNLGGPNYRRIGPRYLDREGREVPGNRGYRYFGAARELPGVRELFEQEPMPVPKKSRAELMKDIDADYYGYRDDDDGILIPLEQEAEKEAVAKAVAEWQAKKEAGLLELDKNNTEENIYTTRKLKDDSVLADSDEEMETEAPRFVAHVAVPSQKEVEEAILRRKKQELLEKYVSSELLMETEETSKNLQAMNSEA
uniref:EOG090X09UC n=1 Tax=Daphnia similis TaxID=35528 RepID=A0A4Y7N379_9CRUS|nr:EOG090X09UC [Daphnia similis]SVE86885.1 EOG090X09UC [Daphnia similis]SVE87510.1 EOG090X09UC [Daphnia similis]SVE88139.1 EOG090X09UC [Daphnia similis]